MLGEPTKAQIAEAYQLTQPAGASNSKKQKKTRNPKDLSAVIAAGKKKAKAENAQEAKVLGDDPNERLRETGNRTGLRNLGATCYMNSLLQTLYMNRSFRRGIFSWRLPDSDKRKSSDYRESIMHQVQLLFANLQHSNAACYDPEELTKGLNIDVGVQQDAQEFNKLILTFLEDQLQHSPDQSLHGLVQKHFRGEFCYSTICQSCKQPSQSSHNKYPFYELELNLKPTLAESLADYVQSDYLEGDNQYLCENCNGKRDATRQIALRSLPPVLTLQLLRFVFDPVTFGKKKVTSSITFPEVLDMSPYVNKDGGEGGSSGGGDMKYRLTAVLMHTGPSAHAGHYTARIMEQPPGEVGDGDGAAANGHNNGGGASSLDDARWWTFNDETVTLEDWKTEKQASAGVAVVTPGGSKGGGGKDGGKDGKSSAKKAAKGKKSKKVIEDDDDEDAEAALFENAPVNTTSGDAGAAAPSSGPRMFISKTAYMLNYTLESTLLAEATSNKPLEAPQDLRETIDAANVALFGEIEVYKDTKEKQEKGRDERDDLFGEIVSMTGGPPASGDGRWISESWLEKVIGLPPSIVPPIDNTCLQCAHGKADPQSIQMMRLISSGLWDKLHTRFGGGPELLDSGCPECVKANRQQQDQKDDQKKLHSALSSALAQAPPDPEFMDAECYYVPKTLTKRWERLLKDKVEDVTSELLSPHNKKALKSINDARLIDSTGWTVVLTVFPSSVAIPWRTTSQCEICAESQKKERESSKHEKLERNHKRTKLQRLLDVESNGGGAGAGADSYSGSVLTLTLPDVQSSLPFSTGSDGMEVDVEALPTLYVVSSSWIEAFRADDKRKSGKEASAGPLSAQGVLCDQNKLRMPPDICRSWKALEESHGASAASGVEGAVDKKLGGEITLLYADEVDSITDGNKKIIESLPSCCYLSESPYKVGKLVLNEPFTVCQESYATARETAKQGILAFEDETIYVHKVERRPDGLDKKADKASAATNGAGDGMLATTRFFQGEMPGAGGNAARRSRRSGGGGALNIKASGMTTLNALKLLIWQKSSDSWPPSQQFIFFNGFDLGVPKDDDTKKEGVPEDPEGKTLSEFGIVPGDKLQLYIDTSIEADTEEALAKLTSMTSEEKGGKARKAEDGFAGSALMSSFSPLPAAATPKGEADGGDGDPMSVNL